METPSQAAKTAGSRPSEQNSKPLVSVIIRSMDRGTLGDALRSVVAQTYSHIEIVIVNAKGSPHSDVDELCGELPVRLVDKGAALHRSKAANEGLDAAQGEYLIFLDDDDWFLPEHIESLVWAQQKYADVDVVYSSVQCVDDNEQQLPTVYNFPFDPLLLLLNNYIPIHAALFSRSLVAGGCRIDESLDLYEDWDFWIQASMKTAFRHIDVVTAVYRINGESGFGVNHKQHVAERCSLIVFEKWIPQIRGDLLLRLTHYARQYGASENRIAALQEEMKSLHITVGERDKKVELLNHDNGWLNSENQGLKNDKSELQKNIQNAIKSNTRLMEEKQVLVQRVADLTVGKSDLQREKSSLLKQMTELQKQKKQLNQRQTELSRQLEQCNQQIEALYQSHSWQVTRPLRGVKTVLDKVSLHRVLRKLYYSVPLSFTHKMRLKGLLFRSVPWVFKGTRAYHNWLAFTGQSVPQRIQSEKSSPVGGAMPSSGLAESYRFGLDMAQKKQSPDFVPNIKDQTDLSQSSTKLIAFYLPQFHPISENDREWGKGFTEWTNVSKAVPQFVGHNQPRLPGELGFYDLRMKDVQRRQIELAREYGIHGFCYYHYWFDGHKVLEKPLQQILDDPSLDLPFCVCWANENWTRRWDGGGNDIILAQNHSPEDDLAFIQDLEVALKDKRYIRIEGKALLIVYRPDLLPDARATAERWREYCRSSGVGELYILGAEAFGFHNYKDVGYDGLVQFPPNNFPADDITDEVELLNKNYQGRVFDYRTFAQKSIESVKNSSNTFPSVMMDWDNEARKPGRGSTYYHGSPQNYRRWLQSAIDFVKGEKEPEQQMVFINAWNEWAEGTYLEPDRRYGYAYLHESREALKASIRAESTLKIVLVCHDAHPHGAQYLVLHMAQVLSRDFHFDVALVLLGGGSLLSEYQRWATVYDLSTESHDGDKAREVGRLLFQRGYRSALVNTTVSGLYLKTLTDVGFRCVSLIHELPGVITANNLQKRAQIIARNAAAVVFPAEQVAESFPSRQLIEAERLVIRPQGLYKRNGYQHNTEEARVQLRRQLDLAESSQIVLGVGYADERKGIDLFVEAGLEVMAAREQVFFVWLGHWEASIQDKISARLKGEALADRFIFPGRRDDTDQFYAGADVYALTSREDPFPSVVMESLSVSVPVIGFRGCGGTDTLIQRDCGALVDMEDSAQLAACIMDFLEHPDKSRKLGETGQQLIQEEFSFRHYMFDLLGLSGAGLHRVSVIVPNFNYARYLVDRITSVIDQTYPIWELIVLDDASSDDSLDVLRPVIEGLAIDVRLVVNDENSGNVFKQWQKGVNLSRGDYIWIAEADDLAEPEFLEKVMPAFDDVDTVISYSESRQINTSGNVLADSYHDYVADIDNELWKNDFTIAGEQAVSRCLAVKNTLPNVSAVVFRTQALKSVLNEHLDDICSFRIAGDWLTYLYMMQHGKLSFSAQPLNQHRRHDSSVTLASFDAAHLSEIIRVQNFVQENWAVDDRTVQQSRAYCHRLYQQFGLDSLDDSRDDLIEDCRKYIGMS